MSAAVWFSRARVRTRSHARARVRARVPLCCYAYTGVSIALYKVIMFTSVGMCLRVRVLCAHCGSVRL